MMNLLARILSHGFALAVVVLVAITLMYRGDLFPEWELPEFLVIEDKSRPGAEVPVTAVDSTSPETAISSPAATVSVAPPAPPVDVAPDTASDTHGLPAEPLVVVPEGSSEAGSAVAADITSSVADEPDATGSRITGDTDQAIEAPAVPSVPVTESEVISEQPESPAADMPPPTQDTESVNEPAAEQESAGEQTPVVPVVPVTESEVLSEQPESLAADMPPPALATESVNAAATEQESAVEQTPVVPVVSVEESEVVAEQAESALVDMTISTPDTEPVTEPGSESLPVAAPIVTSAAGTEDDILTGQPEPLTTEMTAPAPVIESVTESKREPEPGPETLAAVPVVETAVEDEVVVEQVDMPSPDTTAPAPASDPVTGAEMEPTVAETPPATLATDEEKSAYESLAAAREAYWLHDFEGAESHYRRLIQLESDNPDWYGELGNMYFAQGQWEQAATAYYEAGIRLLNDGKVVQARQMVNVIRGLNGAGADDLEAQINNADQVSR